MLLQSQDRGRTPDMRRHGIALAITGRGMRDTAAGVYRRPFPLEPPMGGKLTMQKSERQSFTVRTYLKRVARKPLWFSRSYEPG